MKTSTQYSAFSRVFCHRAACVPSFTLAACLLLLAAPECEAGNSFWTAANNNNRWDSQEGPIGGPTTSNWTNAIPDADDLAVFDDRTLANPIHTTDLNGDRSVLGVIFQSDTHTLGTAVGTHTLTVGSGDESLLSVSIGSSDPNDTTATPVTHVVNCNVAMNDTSGDNSFDIFVIEGNELVINGVISGTNNLYMGVGNRFGTLVLSNANTYTGGTTIHRGTVRATNTTGSATGTGPVTVEGNLNAILSGTGRIGGAITVESEGSIAPGNSIGTLTALSGVTLNGSYACEIGGAAADRLAVTGTLDVRNGTLDLTELSAPTGTSYTIATATTVQGPFATVTGLPDAYQLVYNANSIVLERASPLYVDASASGADSGVSWANAFTRLQDALAVAISGDEIRIASGTYYPDEGGSQSNGDRSSSFHLVSGVTLLGGYPAGGGSTRDPSANPTYLSGDLAKNDGASFSNTSDNAYHVVTGSSADATAVVDGVIIKAGNASGTLYNSFGGGLLCEAGGSPTFRNCKFLGNQAVQQGAAAYLDGSSPSFTNCYFQGNQALGDGGAVYVLVASPSFVNCVFVSNHASSAGGAATLSLDSGGPDPLFVNCTFQGNKAGSLGGALYLDEMNVDFKNCIIWNNETNGDTTSVWSSIFSPVFTPEFTNCLVENWTLTQMGGSGNLDGTDPDNDPQFVSPANLAQNPFSDGDLRLSYLSPAIDAGDNAAVTGISEDISGGPRILNGMVDLGAYENNSPYRAWINGFLPGETDPSIIGPAADPGQNGMNNALSFITNTSPLATEPVQPFEFGTEGDGQLLGVPDGNSGWEGFDAYLEYSFDLENFERILLDPSGNTGGGTEIEPGIEFIQWSAGELCLIGADKTMHPKCFVRLSVDIP